MAASADKAAAALEEQAQRVKQFQVGAGNYTCYTYPACLPWGRRGRAVGGSRSPGGARCRLWRYHFCPAPPTHLPAHLPPQTQMQDNLGERLRLLAELHWSLPRPASRAEQRFAHEQLPAYEAAAAALQEDAQALRARVGSLQRKLRSVGEAAANAAAAAGAAAVPPHQLRRVREALAEQEQQIGANQQRLAVLDAAVAAAAVQG